MKRNKKLAAYKNRIKAAVDAIYTLTYEQPLTDGFAKYRKNALFTHCGSVLRQLGVVINTGNQTKPVYSWNENSEPTKDLYRQVYVFPAECRNKSSVHQEHLVAVGIQLASLIGF